MKKNSYQILAPALMQTEKDVKKAAGGCLDSIKLDPDLYRLGHTKVNHLNTISWKNLIFCPLFLTWKLIGMLDWWNTILSIESLNFIHLLFHV